jgi:hypothetical protein
MDGIPSPFFFLFCWFQTPVGTKLTSVEVRRGEPADVGHAQIRDTGPHPEVGEAVAARNLPTSTSSPWVITSLR